MSTRHISSIAVTTLLILGSLSGGVAFALGAFDDGNDASTAWRRPQNDLTPQVNEASSDISQLVQRWAQDIDGQNAPVLARLFAPNASLSLFATDTTTDPWTQLPTGYSPAASPTGGSAGGGCVVTGYRQLVNYYIGIGLTGNYTSPDTAVSRTRVFDVSVKVASHTATSHYYIATGPFQGGHATAQVFGNYRYQRARGWQITSLRLLYPTAQPDLPCQTSGAF